MQNKINHQSIIGILMWMVTCIASAQSIRWEPEFLFPGTFFPAFVISTAGMDKKGPIDSPSSYGFLNSGSLGVKILSAPLGSRIKVQVEINEIGVSGEIDTDISIIDKPKIIVPRLSWSQSKLVSIDQPISSEVVFRVYENGVLINEERRPVRIRAINDAPLRSCRSPKECRDFSLLMAAFVNENNPVIDSVLRAALNIPAMPVKQWIGTQGSTDDVLRQVWALWYLFQRNKVTYSSITTVSEAQQGVFSQTVRPLSQTLRTAQANCIDGTALFASILRKIGIEPIIVLVPGHAFLGFFVDAQKNNPMFLETTQLNDVNNPFNNNSPTQAGIALSKILGQDIHMNKSWSSFLSALKVGQQRYNQAVPNFGKQPGFMLIPISKAREAGIMPLPL